MSDFNSVQVFPSFEYQISAKFFSVSDQPPNTHIRFRYTTVENHNRGFHAALSVTNSQFTPSSEHQTSLVGMAFGALWPPPMIHIFPSKTRAWPWLRFDQGAFCSSSFHVLPSVEDQTSFIRVESLLL